MEVIEDVFSINRDAHNDDSDIEWLFGKDTSLPNPISELNPRSMILIAMGIVFSFVLQSS